MTYERVTYQDENRKRTIYLRDPREIQFLGSPALTGVRVNKETDEVAPRGVDEVRQIITMDLVSKRTPMVVSRHYGWLVEETC